MNALANPAVEVSVNEETGARVYRLGEVESTVACAVCGVPIIPVARGQRTCGAPRCREALRVVTPGRVAAARARNAAWCAEHRGCTRKRPWLAGEPPHLPHLPGGGMTIAISPTPQWPIEHRNVRALHGLMTTLVGLPHQRWPEWALVPWPSGCGWGVYLRQDEVAQRLAGRALDGVLFDRPVTVTTGPLVRVKAPSIARRGRQRVQIDTITPVCIEVAGRTETRAAPTSSALLSALTVNLPERLGLQGLDPATVMLEVVNHETQTASVPVGGKWGDVRGWAGSVVVEVNAVARWLLEATARGPGLGGRTAIGFGRVRVSPCP